MAAFVIHPVCRLIEECERAWSADPPQAAARAALVARPLADNGLPVAAETYREFVIVAG